jgi:hypothetical protein
MFTIFRDLNKKQTRSDRDRVWPHRCAHRRREHRRHNAVGSSLAATFNNVSSKL